MFPSVELSCHADAGEMSARVVCSEVAEFERHTNIKHTLRQNLISHTDETDEDRGGWRVRADSFAESL